MYYGLSLQFRPEHPFKENNTLDQASVDLSRGVTIQRFHDMYRKFLDRDTLYDTEMKGKYKLFVRVF